jgi:hypothetical protein
MGAALPTQEGRMNASEKRILLPLLKRIHHGETPSFRMRSAAQFLLHRLGKPSKKGKKAQAARKSAKAVQHTDSTASIREAVMQRANGNCEACGKAWGVATMDHWSCGTGKSQRQTVENCWFLCGAPFIPGSCHYLRQRNEPSISVWNELFRIHAKRHGLPVIAHIVHQQLSTQGSEAGIPPNATSPVPGRKEEDSNA